MLKKLLSPKVIIPVILLIGVVAALLAFGNVNRVLALVTGFNRIYLIWFFLSMIAYAAIRGLQWHILLRALSIDVPLRAQVFSFLMGEMTKSLPVGNYFQNYILQRSRGADFGRTSAASTLVIVTEVIISLLGCVIIGVGSWEWVRPLILVGGFLFIVGAAIFIKVHDPSNPHQWTSKHKILRKIIDEFNQFRAGVTDLMHPRVLLLESACSAGYLVVGGAGLWLVAAGLGVSGISFPAALSVYFFSLAVSLIIPIPIDLGVDEISGVGAFLAFGAEKSAAVGIMLLNRFLSLASAFIMGIIAMLVFHDELRKAMQERPPKDGKQHGQRGNDERVGAA
jgi:uncharacterized protein (TIRG00374 family)